MKIVSITPRSCVSSGSTLHGSMINPGVNGAQGYDSRLRNNTYSATLNVGARLPLIVQPASSLLSVESFPVGAAECASTKGDAACWLKSMAILTVLGSPAPSGSFRPPPVGTNKTLSWNKSQLNYSKLKSLPIVPNTPSLSSVEALFARPWSEQGTTWVARYLHPALNQPQYGREMAHALAKGLLSLQLNYTNAQKETLLIRMVQYGIDVYGAASVGAIWPAGGGHNHGRKMPMLLAGTMLGDANILSYANGQKLIFQEDRQTWYVSQSDVGRTLYTADGRPRDRYIQSDVGTPEWGEKHYNEPQWDGRNWGAYYRDIAGCSTIGHVLAARIMGLQSTWNWPAIFDYYDRYYSVESGQASTASNEIQPFVKSMWVAYRNAMPAVLNDSTVATSIWASSAITAQTGCFNIAFDLMPSSSTMDGVTGLCNGSADDYSDLAAAVRFASTGCIDVRNGGGWQAAATLRYSAGVKYHVVMAVNIPAHTYSVTVTPAGGSAVKLATDWKFRTEQQSVTRLDHVGFFASPGSHSVNNIGVQ